MVEPVEDTVKQPLAVNPSPSTPTVSELEVIARTGVLPVILSSPQKKYLVVVEVPDDLTLNVNCINHTPVGKVIDPENIGVLVAFEIVPEKVIVSVVVYPI